MLARMQVRGLRGSGRAGETRHEYVHCFLIGWYFLPASRGRSSVHGTLRESVSQLDRHASSFQSPNSCLGRPVRVEPVI